MSKDTRSLEIRCQFVKTKYGMVTGCGRRAAWNKFWLFCPYCGHRIIVINRDAREDD